MRIFTLSPWLPCSNLNYQSPYPNTCWTHLFHCRYLKTLVFPTPSNTNFNSISKHWSGKKLSCRERPSPDEHRFCFSSSAWSLKPLLGHGEACTTRTWSAHSLTTCVLNFRQFRRTNKIERSEYTRYRNEIRLNFP